MIRENSRKLHSELEKELEQNMNTPECYPNHKKCEDIIKTNELWNRIRVGCRCGYYQYK